MPGDGVSLPTTLAQMGSVAKTQARGQQASPQVTPFSEQKSDKDALTVQRVRETDPGEKSRVKADREERDTRKRRRLKRNRHRFGSPHGETSIRQDRDGGEQDDPQGQDHPDQADGLGSLIDLRV
jgi:hypothetical protein